MTDAWLLDLDSALWRFAIRFYVRPGVAPACLTLQEGVGLDVNVLLLALFAHLERGQALDDAAISEADQAAAPWREAIVQPLRQVRTALKTGPAPAPSPETEGLRDEVKRIELRAEQIELAVFLRWLDGRGDVTAPAEGDPVETVARFYAADDNRLAEPAIADAIRAIGIAADAWRPASTLS